MLRHAKAAEHAPEGGGDHERPLAPRGRRDAAALGRQLAEGGVGLERLALPTHVLCSTAQRTTETAERVVGELGLTLDRRRSLYYAGPTSLLDEVRTLPDGVASAMVVGHNPTMAELAHRLLAPGDEGLGVLDGHGFPTCGLAVIRMPAARWVRVAEGTGSLEAFITPPY